jgi:putative hydrolase of the HAD superfamily
MVAGSPTCPRGSGVRAVLFDFFGTLTHAYRRGPGHTQLAEVINCDPAEYLALLERSYPQRVRGEYGDLVSTMLWVADQLGATLSPDQLDRAVRTRMDATRHSIRLRAEAMPILAQLRAAGMATGLVSDCTHEIPMIMPELPIADMLQATVYSVVIGAAKPEPAMFITAAELLDVAPGECLYIGDGGGHELSGARAVGMTAIRLTAPDLTGHRTYDPDPDLGGPSIDSLSEIPVLLSQGPY